MTTSKLTMNVSVILAVLAMALGAFAPIMKEVLSLVGAEFIFTVVTSAFFGGIVATILTYKSIKLKNKAMVPTRNVEVKEGEGVKFMTRELNRLKGTIMAQKQEFENQVKVAQQVNGYNAKVSDQLFVINKKLDETRVFVGQMMASPEKFCINGRTTTTCASVAALDNTTGLKLASLEDRLKSLQSEIAELTNVSSKVGLVSIEATQCLDHLTTSFQDRDNTIKGIVEKLSQQDRAEDAMFQQMEINMNSALEAEFEKYKQMLHQNQNKSASAGISSQMEIDVTLGLRTPTINGDCKSWEEKRVTHIRASVASPFTVNHKQMNKAEQKREPNPQTYQVGLSRPRQSTDSPKMPALRNPVHSKLGSIINQLKKNKQNRPAESHTNTAKPFNNQSNLPSPPPPPPPTMPPNSNTSKEAKGWNTAKPFNNQSNLPPPPPPPPPTPPPNPNTSKEAKGWNTPKSFINQRNLPPPPPPTMPPKPNTCKQAKEWHKVGDWWKKW